MIRKFIRATEGNLAITFAIAAIPVMFALGATVDYGVAARVRAKMDAAADAAALSAVSPDEMSQSTTIAQQNAVQVFNSLVSAQTLETGQSVSTLLPNQTTTQGSGLSFLIYNASATASSTCTNGRPPAGFNLCVQVVDSLQGNQRIRNVTVAYEAAVQTTFSAILQKTSIGIGGMSTSNAATSPNIDFYLMLDTSPSMAIPATTDGINWMMANTPYQDGGTASNPVGCAFACHESNPSAESSGGTRAKPVFGNQGCPDDPLKRAGPCLDNYQLARNGTLPNGSPIVLRTDLVQQAVVNLIGTAQSTEATTGAAYRLAGYTFDATVNLPVPLQSPSSTAQSQASNIQMLEVTSNNVLNGQSNNDEDTLFDSALTRLNNDMTSAGVGSGTNNPGDKPQQVLMIVTDGVADENWNGGRNYLPLGGTTSLSTNINAWCQQIKNSTPNRRIAVLYLTYNPLPNNSWYNTYISTEQNSIYPVLQACASSGLFFQVNTGGDVTAAMNALFLEAVQGAHLTN